ncbi:hypothetical protein AA3250_0443 [Gluconobacter albidus NBRC 3250]|nr:hypothetical protein AA3250_0443 [Gluconobacter albidus NBRC 3250]
MLKGMFRAIRKTVAAVSRVMCVLRFQKQAIYAGRLNSSKNQRGHPGWDLQYRVACMGARRRVGNMTDAGKRRPVLR